MQKPSDAEIGGDCRVGGIASARQDNAADAQPVMTGVYRVPPPAQENVEPGAKIHRLRAFEGDIEAGVDQHLCYRAAVPSPLLP